MRKVNLRKVFVGLAAMSMMCVWPALKVYGQEIGGEMTPEVKWYIEGETLHISGKGVVPTTLFGQQSPWHPYRSQFNAVVLEEGITEVGKFVFNKYKNITSLTIARSVENLANNSFSGCSRLATVEVKSTIPPTINVGTFILSKTKKAKLIVPDGCKAEYKETPFWKKFGTVEESGQAAADADDVNRILDAPCTVRLYREPRFSGGGANVSVYLNGVEQEKLGNGKTIEMTTDRMKNRIVIKWRKSDMGYLRFDAISGGEIQINYSAATGNVKIME
ncbi:MAG: leucine-rich repeat domain-containing protein [Prevotellaceae bacterium]|jgi:hypothetical protein|nr:leucine-rich repeat domain-containing protein [Prevotellaceae bacterium]